MDIIGKYTGDMERKSAHKKCEVNKTKASRGAGIDTASWMRTGVVGGMPRRDSATGQIFGVTKSFSDVTTNVRSHIIHCTLLLLLCVCTCTAL